MRTVCWSSVHNPDDKPDLRRLMLICGPKLWAGEPGYALAMWEDDKDWYDMSGLWFTVDGTEIHADEVEYWCIPQLPWKKTRAEFPI